MPVYEPQRGGVTYPGSANIKVNGSTANLERPGRYRRAKEEGPLEVGALQEFTLQKSGKLSRPGLFNFTTKSSTELHGVAFLGAQRISTRAAYTMISRHPTPPGP